MKDFNLITDMLRCTTRDCYPMLLTTKSRCLTYIIGKHGDFHSWKHDWRTKSPMIGKTNASVLIIVQQDNYLEWKLVYKNSKGYYIKKDNQNVHFEIE